MKEERAPDRIFRLIEYGP